MKAAPQAFKDGAVRFLICTDVAARGLDISGLPYVINVTLPDRAEDYIHRVGRVGKYTAIGSAPDTSPAPSPQFNIAKLVPDRSFSLQL